MKKIALRTIRLTGAAALIALITGLMVSGIGWLAGWHTAAQFSNGLSGTGSVIFVLGILSLMGGYRMRSSMRVANSPPAGGMNLGDRTRQWMADVTQGYNTVVLLGMAGILLVGISILLGRLSGAG
jgi:hypothetical protein